MYTPSAANVAKFTQHLLTAPSASKPALASSKYDYTNKLLDQIQAKLNPHIQQANSNASLIHNYLAGNTQYPSYSHPNVGGGSGPSGQVPVQGTMPQPVANSSQRDYSSYAQYIPHLQAMASQVMQQRMPKMQDPVDLSPYTAFANSARMRGGMYNV